MRNLTRFSIAFVLMTVAGLAWADRWVSPTPQAFKSANGQHVFRTEPGKKFLGPASGALKTKRDTEAAEFEVWQAKLVNLPHQAFVSEDGTVVTVDTYANLGYKHSLVVYDAKGKAIADYELEQLLTEDEIMRHVLLTEGSRRWAKDAKFSFDAKEQQFVINMKWGKEMRVSLKTGKIVAAK